MKTGIPELENRFYLADDEFFATSEIMGGFLYILYIHKSDDIEGTDFILKKFDLNTFDGNEDEVNPIYSIHFDEKAIGSLSCSNKHLEISGKSNRILDIDNLSIAFSEEEMDVPDSWAEIGSFFIFENQYYRIVDFRDRTKGIDVVDMENKCVVEHIDCDINTSNNPENGLLIGLRPNNYFSIYSIDKRDYVFELDFSPYIEKMGRAVFSETSDEVVLACGDVLVVIDLNTYKIVNKINYLDFPVFFDYESTLEYRGSSFLAEGISVIGSTILIRNYFYLACFDLSTDKLLQWVNFDRDVTAKNIEGDLIFGVKNSKPTAWDKYSGEQVWQSKYGTFSKNISIGGQWLIYSQVGGKIQCFHWDEPYDSPHKPC